MGHRRKRLGRRADLRPEYDRKNTGGFAGLFFFGVTACLPRPKIAFTIQPVQLARLIGYTIKKLGRDK